MEISKNKEVFELVKTNLNTWHTTQVISQAHPEQTIHINYTF